MAGPALRGIQQRIDSIGRSGHAAANAAVFFLKVLPMLPSGGLDRVTPAPVVERLRYATRRGEVEGDLWRPATPGPHPGMVVCLGVVPFGVDHPQTPRLGAALARSGFAALLYWSPAMRDYRLEPDDISDIASAYQALLARADIDPARSGLLGTCVGGSFALMAAANPRIRDQVAFVAAFAPYSSMWTLARDIASNSCSRGAERQAWPVDPLTRRVFVQSLTAMLAPEEAERVRAAVSERREPGALSTAGHAIYHLLGDRLDVEAAEVAEQRLPAAIHERLAALSPSSYLDDLRAPLLIIGHDRDDLVIPVGESRRLRSLLRGRAGLRYTEFALFQHADPTKRSLPPWRLAWELSKFFHYVYPVFRQAAPGSVVGRPATKRLIALVRMCGCAHDHLSLAWRVRLRRVAMLSQDDRPRSVTGASDMSDKHATTHGDDDSRTTKSAQTEGDAIQRQGQAIAPDQPSQAEGDRETIDEDMSQKNA